MTPPARIPGRPPAARRLRRGGGARKSEAAAGYWNCSLTRRSSRPCPGSKRIRWATFGSDLTFTDTTSGTEMPPASAITGRFLASRTSNLSRADSGSTAPRQRRGRKAAIGVSASTFAPIGRIGPCAL